VLSPDSKFLRQLEQ